jgi:hypothetical protein
MRIADKGKKRSDFGHLLRHEACHQKGNAPRGFV